MRDDDNLLGDISALDPVYVDGVISGGIANLGANVSVPFFRWIPERTSEGLRLQRQPVLVLVGPRQFLLPASPYTTAAELEPPLLLIGSGSRH
jgi:hypothetical protein